MMPSMKLYHAMILITGAMHLIDISSMEIPHEIEEAEKHIFLSRPASSTRQAHANQLSQEIQQKIIDEVLTGKSYAKISSQLGISGPSISKYVRAAGLSSMVLPPRFQHLSAEQIEQISHKIKDGKTYIQISDELGIDILVILRQVRTLGLVPLVPKKGRHLPDEKIQKIYQGISEGKSYKEIVRTVGVSFFSVAKYAQRIRVVDSFFSN